MKKTITTLIIIILLLLGFCEISMAQNPDDVIILGDGNWPGLRGKNAIVKCILENIGYKVERTFASEPMLRQGVAEGDIDIYLGAWMPSLKESKKKNMDKYNFVTVNMHEGLSNMAVPAYVYNEGIKDFTDLSKYAEKFNKKFYAGPVDWVYDDYLRKIVKNDMYGLGDWEIVTSNKAGLMAALKKAIKNEEWICHCAWKPQWTNIVFDIKYLDDPKNVWPNKHSWVDTYTRKGFPEDHPELMTFLKQFIISVETNSLFSLEIGEKKRDPDTFAKEWVKNNISTVSRFLFLVKAKNGEPAIKVLKKNLNIN